MKPALSNAAFAQPNIDMKVHECDATTDR